MDGFQMFKIKTPLYWTLGKFEQANRSGIRFKRIKSSLIPQPKFVLQDAGVRISVAISSVVPRHGAQ